MIGHKQGAPIGDIKRIILKKPLQCIPRLIIFVAGVVWIKTERPEADYTEYLGPDWKRTYKGAGTLIFNHSSWIVSYFPLSTYINSYIK